MAIAIFKGSFHLKHAIFKGYNSRIVAVYKERQLQTR